VTKNNTFGSPVEKSVEEVFSGNEIFLVPELQRDYSWGKTQIDDLINDILFVNEHKIEKYYFGPAVLISEGDNVKIIDGQQRLSTVLLFFRIIKDFVDDIIVTKKEFEDKKKFSKKLNDFIYHTRKKTPRLALGSVDNENFLELMKDDDPATKIEFVKKNLKKEDTINPKLYSAYKIIFNHLKEGLRKIEKDIELPINEKFDPQIKKLKNEIIRKNNEQKKFPYKEEKNPELKKRLKKNYDKLKNDKKKLSEDRKKIEEKKEDKISKLKPKIVSKKLHYLKTLEKSTSEPFTFLQFKEEYDDAHLLFETLNNRGRSLSQNDLIKNQIIKFSSKGKDFESDWMKIKKNVGSYLDSFLADYCTMLYGYTTPKKIYKKFKKEHLKDSTKIESLLKDLIKNSKTYKQILSPNKKDWNNPKIVDKLNDLNSLSSIVFRPLFLYVKTKGMDTKYIAELSEYCLKTFVNFKTIGNGRFEELKTLNDDVIKILKKGPLIITPELKNKFKNIFDEKRFEKLETFSTKRNETIKIILKRIYFPTKIMNSDDLELEHIVPQTVYDNFDKNDISEDIQKWIDYVKTNSKFEKDHVYFLGNTALVTDDENKKLGTKSFKDKIKILSNSDWKYTKIIAKSPKWGITEIKSRQSKLSTEIKKVWDLKI